MSKFVNFKKRGVSLPPGCTDLIDLLKPQQPNAGPMKADEAEELPTELRSHFEGRLQDGTEHIRKGLQQEIRPALMCVNAADERFTLTVRQMVHCPTAASIWVIAKSEDEARVRAFLSSRDCEVEPDGGMPSVFVPNVPVQVTIDVRPLPIDSPALVDLLLALLREGLRLTDDHEISVFHYAKTA